MAITFEGTRFANGSLTWQANEDTDVTGWDKDTVGIIAAAIGTNAHNGDDVTPGIYWRNVTDAGSFAVIGATGEVKYTTVSALTDEDDLLTTNFGCTSARTAQNGITCEQENSHQATNVTSLPDEFFTEIQVGISFADGDPGDEYEFAAYDGATLVLAGISVTLTAGATPQSVVAVAIGVATVVRKIKKGISATAVGSPSVSKKRFLTVTATAIGVPVVSTKSMKTVVVTAIAIGVPLVAKKIKKTIAATAVASPSITRKILKTVAATAVGVPIVTPVVTSFQTVTATAIGVATSAQLFIAAVAGRTLTRIIGGLGWIGKR